MNVLFLEQEEAPFQKKLALFENCEVKQVDSTITLMEIAESGQPDAIVIPSNWNECPLIGLMEAIHSVSPASALLIVGAPLEKDLVDVVNYGKPDQLLKINDQQNWRGQIARAVAQKSQLKLALLENERLERRNSQLEFHLRQLMQVQSV